jgi:hypothetical protein
LTVEADRRGYTVAELIEALATGVAERLHADHDGRGLVAAPLVLRCTAENVDEVSDLVTRLQQLVGSIDGHAGVMILPVEISP